MIVFDQKGDFKKLETFLKNSVNKDYKSLLKQIAEKGVQALSEATPKRTGKTAASWKYNIKEEQNQLVITWENTNVVSGVNVAMILQYGHTTKGGYRIEGIDYINPALDSVFKELAEAAWKEVNDNASGR